jgi:hypothetical protein
MGGKLNEMKDTIEAIRLGGRHFRCLLYADDIDLFFSNNALDLRKVLLVVEEISLHRFRFGIRKM